MDWEADELELYGGYGRLENRSEERWSPEREGFPRQPPVSPKRAFGEPVPWYYRRLAPPKFEIVACAPRAV